MFGIGLAAYWSQFEGLKERMEGYHCRVRERVAELGAEVISAGLWAPSIARGWRGIGSPLLESISCSVTR